jgi:hypothetical protein
MRVCVRACVCAHARVCACAHCVCAAHPGLARPVDAPEVRRARAVGVGCDPRRARQRGIRLAHLIPRRGTHGALKGNSRGTQEGFAWKGHASRGWDRAAKIRGIVGRVVWLAVGDKHTPIYRRKRSHPEPSAPIAAASLAPHCEPPRSAASVRARATPHSGRTRAQAGYDARAKPCMAVSAALDRPRGALWGRHALQSRANARAGSARSERAARGDCGRRASRTRRLASGRAVYAARCAVYILPLRLSHFASPTSPLPLSPLPLRRSHFASPT